MWLSESAANIFAIDRENPVKPKELPWYWSDSIIAGIVKDYVVGNLSEVNGNQVGIIDLCEFDYTPNAILKLNRFDAEVRADLRKITDQL